MASKVQGVSNSSHEGFFCEGVQEFFLWKSSLGLLKGGSLGKYPLN